MPIKSKKQAVILSVLLALAGALSLPRMAALENGSAAVSNSVLCVLFAIAAYFLIERALLSADMRLTVFALVGGCVLSAFLAVGSRIYADMHFSLSIGNLAVTVVAALAFMPTAAAVIALLFRGIPRANVRLRQMKLEQSRWNPAANHRVKPFLLIWAALLLCWLPAYLAYFPGIWGYDMHNQNFQALTHVYNTFQPLLHTLLHEVTYKLGVAVFGTGTGGVAVFTAVQGLILSACLAYVCTYLAKRWKVPFLVTILAVAFYALLPVHAVMACSSTKDTVYVGLFLVLLTQVYDLCMEPEPFLKNWKRPALFVGTVLLVCLLRNNMIYAMLMLAPFVILGVKQKRVWIAGLLLVSMAASFVGGKMFQNAFDARDGARVEMLSIPIQQVSRVYSLHGGELTEEERLAIFEYLPEEAVKNYFPLLSDPVKDHCNIGEGMPAILGFLNVWKRFLPRYLNDYTDAFLLMTLGYWYPDENFHDRVYSGYDEPDTEESLGYLYTGFMESINGDVEQKHLFPAAERYYQWFMHENGHEGIPVLSMLFSPGFYCWMLFLALLGLLYFKRLNLLWPLVLPLGVWLTLLLGPCMIVRYAYPVMAAFPLLAGVFFNGREADALRVPETNSGSGSGRGAEVLRFAVAGLVGFIVDYGVLILLTETAGVHYLLAAALAFSVSVAVNYLMCAYWVFRSSGTGSRGVQAAFLLTSLVGLGLNELFMLLFVDALHIHYLIAKVFSTVLVMVWNYFSKRKVLVRHDKKTEERK